MSHTPINWDEDLPYDAAEEYQTLTRALRRKQGFGLFFVECSSEKSNEIIANLRGDLPQKTMQILQLDRSTTTLYDRVEVLWQQQPFDILLIQGLENALVDYEDTKRFAGWSSQEIYSYSWKGVPRILNHLNQQRERFRDSFNCSFIFFVPLFAIKYFIQRAPDFFDWRSGLFRFPMDADRVRSESWQIYFNDSKLETYQSLNLQERKAEIFRLQALIDEESIPSEEKADLLCEQAFLLQLNGENEAAIICCDKAIDIDSNRYRAWLIRSAALETLGRNEEAIESQNRCKDLNKCLIGNDKQNSGVNNAEHSKGMMIISDVSDDYSIILDLNNELNDFGKTKVVMNYPTAASCGVSKRGKTV